MLKKQLHSYSGVGSGHLDKIKDKIIYSTYSGRDLPVLPISEYSKIFNLFHLPGHASSSKMIQVMMTVMKV